MGRRVTSQLKTQKRKRGVVNSLRAEVNSSQYEMLRQYAAASGLTLSQAVTDAIHLWLNSLPKLPQQEEHRDIIETPNSCQPSPFEPQPIKVGGLPWVKVYPEKWMYGSTGVMPLDKQAIWLWFIFLAHFSKFRDGTLRHDLGKPYSRDYIAKKIANGISRRRLDENIDWFKKDINAHDGLPRLQEWDDGTLVVTNFVAHQESPKGKRKSSETNDSQEPETTAERELRDRRKCRQLAKTYPEDAQDALHEHQESQTKLAEHNRRVNAIYDKASKT